MCVGLKGRICNLRLPKKTLLNKAVLKPVTGIGFDKL